MTHKVFACLCNVALLPKQDNPYRMGDIGNPHLLTEVPVASVAHADRFFSLPGNLSSYSLQGLFPSVIHQFPVELQIPHIRPLGALNVVEHLGTREIAVKGEVARDGASDGVVDQLNTQLGVVREVPLLARDFSLEPSPFNGIVRSRWADIVRDH